MVGERSPGLPEESMRTISDEVVLSLKTKGQSGNAIRENEPEL